MSTPEYTPTHLPLHGQPYVRVDNQPVPESTVLYPPVRDFGFGLSTNNAANSQRQRCCTGILEIPLFTRLFSVFRGECQFEYTAAILHNTKVEGLINNHDWHLDLRVMNLLKRSLS
jgi:hypothetical protein